MEENIFQQRIDLSGLNKAVLEIRNEIGSVIIGQHKMVDLLMIGLLCDGHILIEGVPGVAKTLTAKIIAKIIDADFSRLQFTPDLMPADITGTDILEDSGDGKRLFRFVKGPVFSNIILADEINRTTPTLIHRDHAVVEVPRTKWVAPLVERATEIGRAHV